MTADTRRKLAAIVSADVAGYSRLMGRDEAGTLARLSTCFDEFVFPRVAARDGRVVKSMGDGLLIEFPSAINAVACALEIQKGMAEREAGIDEDNRIAFRIGVNLGDIIIKGDDIFGDGVNLAARLQEIAEPGGVCVAGVVHEQVSGKIDQRFEDLGHRKLKNIERPVRVYQVSLSGAPADGETRIGWPFLTGATQQRPLTAGGCLCGKVRYEIWGEPVAVGYCHCRFCQLAIGSPVGAWAVCEKKSVSFVGDAAKVFDSSMISERAFCGNCGTSLYTVVKRLGYYAIRLATLNNPEDYPPTVHFGVESQLPWLDIHDDLPRIRTEDDSELSRRWISVGEPGGGPTPGTAEERLRATVKRSGQRE